jgi:hypothetical protein
MLLQTNSYIVPRDKRAEHARLLRRFRQTLLRLGCDHFEVFEQVGPNWSSADSSGRFVQIMRFRDRKHATTVRTAELNDPAAQALLKEFCELINLNYQQQQGLFAAGYYTSFLRMPPRPEGAEASAQPGESEASEDSAESEISEASETSEASEGAEPSEVSEASQTSEASEASEALAEAEPTETSEATDSVQEPDEKEAGDGETTAEATDDSLPPALDMEDEAGNGATEAKSEASAESGDDADAESMFIPGGIDDPNGDTGVTPALDDQAEESENSASEAAPPSEDEPAEEEKQPHKNPFSPFSS